VIACRPFALVLAAATFMAALREATSAEIVDTLNRAINAAFADPAMRARLAATGGAMLPGSPADFGRLLLDETAKWTKVIKFSGARFSDTKPD
jgi:tripartite-type tricarboxylate transporter receptor subunit TctC